MKNNCLILFIGFIGLFFGRQPVAAQTYNEMVEKSYEYADSNNFSAAEQCLKAAMRLEPANPLNYALLTNLGTLQRRLGNPEEALISYTAALNQHPDNPLILSNRAELYTEMHEVDNAIYDYSVILAKDPTNEQSLFKRGLLYINKGEYLLAETDFDLIIDTYEDTFWGRFGFAILQKARGFYDDSEIIFNYLVEKYPDNTRLLEERAELFFLTKRNSRAMSDLNKVFKATPEPSAELYMLRGRVKLAQYEKESAALDFKKALELGYDKETVDRLLKETF